MEGRKVSESRTIQTFLLMPMHVNAKGNLFGGQLLSWIDMIAGIVALRHTDSNVVTVAIDHLEFKQSAHISDVITLDGRVTWTGNTSLEVCVETYKENKGANKVLINKAYLVMVAMDDETDRPKRVPELITESEEEENEFFAGQKRAYNRKFRKEKQF